MAENPPPAAMAASARWLARLTFLCALAAVVVLLVGGVKSLGVLVVAIVGLAIQLAAVWVFLSRRGLGRLLAAVVAIAVPVAVVVIFVTQRLVWDIVVVLLLALATVVTGRAALARSVTPVGMPESPKPPPLKPFVIMNPRSGGGKVVKFHLESGAIALGATVALIEGPGPVDVEALARAAVADGADLLGVAGGDGTQALVAGIAADHDLPFLVISAGTRNHFAMDLGLDRDHPEQGLTALTDGVELVLDLGVVGGRTFVNNASFGAYAAIVQSPAYRDDKRGTTLRMLPDLLSGHRGPHLTVRIDDDLTIDAPKAVLISNNPYGIGDPAGLDRRARLDLGVLGVVAITVDNAAQAAALLRGRHSGGLSTRTAHEVVIDADVEQIAVGIDGESVLLPTPVRCLIRPGALRVRVPHDRVGVLALTPKERLNALRHQALSTGRTPHGAPGAGPPA
jgi:diacylglycerol kinase family enzyme